MVINKHFSHLGYEFNFLESSKKCQFHQNCKWPTFDIYLIATVLSFVIQLSGHFGANLQTRTFYNLALFFQNIFFQSCSLHSFTTFTTFDRILKTTKYVAKSSSLRHNSFLIICHCRHVKINNSSQIFVFLKGVR